jgi:replication fork protection complex subunit Csm3/Swi3
MTSLEDIWDAPLEPSSPRPARTLIVIDSDDEDNDGPRPSKRPRSSQPLFLADSDDEHPDRANNARPVDVDAMFQDIEDEDDEALAFQPLAPALDVDALRRQASAKHANTTVIPLLTPHAILSSSPPRNGAGDNNGEMGKGKDVMGKDGERKERKKIARLDETRLVGPNGFPALIKNTKGFVPKGKGHEVRTLSSSNFCMWGFALWIIIIITFK